MHGSMNIKLYRPFSFAIFLLAILTSLCTSVVVWRWCIEGCDSLEVTVFIILVIAFMQGIYSYIPETKSVTKVHSLGLISNLMH